MITLKTKGDIQLRERELRRFWSFFYSQLRLFEKTREKREFLRDGGG
jgi:hypothetical protein